MGEGGQLPRLEQGEHLRIEVAHAGALRRTRPCLAPGHVVAPVEPDYVDILDEEEVGGNLRYRSEEHTSELQSLMRISYAVFCLKKTKPTITTHTNNTQT